MGAAELAARRLQRAADRSDRRQQTARGHVDAADESCNSDRRHAAKADDDAHAGCCSICMSNPRTTRFRPCGHSCTCALCSLTLIEYDDDAQAYALRCPLCKQDVDALEWAAAGSDELPPADATGDPPRLVRLPTFDGATSSACLQSDGTQRSPCMRLGAFINAVELATGSKELKAKAAELFWLPLNGWQPIFNAVMSGSDTLVDFFLTSKGADPNARGRQTAYGDLLTPLLALAGREDGHGAAPCARLLLDHGALLEATLSDGATALFLACQNGHVGLARLLLERGADVNVRRLHDDDCTPLIIASARGYDAVVRLLLEHGADVDSAASDDGSTALHSASSEGHESVVRALLDHGASTRALDSEGNTPLSILLRRILSDDGHSGAARMLFEAEAERRVGAKERLQVQGALGDDASCSSGVRARLTRRHTAPASSGVMLRFVSLCV